MRQKVIADNYKEAYLKFTKHFWRKDENEVIENKSIFFIYLNNFFLIL